MAAQPAVAEVAADVTAYDLGAVPAAPTNDVPVPFTWTTFNPPLPVFILYPDVAVRFTRYDRVTDRVDPQLYLDPFWATPAPDSEIVLPFAMEACIADGALGLHWRGDATRSTLFTQPTTDAEDIGVGVWNWAEGLIAQIQGLIKEKMAQNIVVAADATAKPIGNRAMRRATPHLLQ